MALRRRSFVPSTARFLFGGTKRKCGVGTVSSKSCHALTGRGQYAPSTRNRYLLYALVFFIGPCGAVLSLVGKYPKDGKRGVSNPPSCNSPQRLLKRRRARYSVQFGKPNDHKIFYPFSHCFSPLGLRKNQIWKGMDTKKVSPSAMGWVSWIPVRSKIAGNTRISGT